MKEVRYFYAPDISVSPVLPDEEAAHAVRVLRLQEGDELLVTDGRGGLFRCHVALASAKHCSVTVDEVLPASKGWPGQVCLAVAPTKNIDRLEWLAEKATEIGFDTLSLLLCDFSERRVVKAERLEKILVAAMKQSHKAWLPRLEAPERFSDFIRRPFDGQKFIAHCYAPSDVGGEEVGKPFLLDALRHSGNALVCVGPEGDFSIDEVRQAIGLGFVPVSLGDSRLRTETAGLVAVHLMHLAQGCANLNK